MSSNKGLHVAWTLEFHYLTDNKLDTNYNFNVPIGIDVNLITGSAIQA